MQQTERDPLENAIVFLLEHLISTGPFHPKAIQARQYLESIANSADEKQTATAYWLEGVSGWRRQLDERLSWLEDHLPVVKPITQQYDPSFGGQDAGLAGDGVATDISKK